MLRCNSCNVDLPGTPKQCPLCKGELTGKGDGGENVFPPRLASQKLFSKKILAITAFVSVCVSAVCIAVNLIFPAGGWWSLFVLAGYLSLWADFAMLYRKRRNFAKSILWQVAFVSAIALLWDFFTGFHGWALDYVLPILCVSAMISIVLLANICKLHVQDYIIYLIIDCVLGVSTLILILTGILHTVIPCAVCFAHLSYFLRRCCSFSVRRFGRKFREDFIGNISSNNTRL